MTWILVTGWVALGLGAFVAIFFTATFAIEREARPALVTLSASIVPLGGMTGMLLYDFPGRDWVVLSLLCAGALTFLLIAGVRTTSEKMKVSGEQKRIDERDALFHRFYRLKPDTAEWKEYYDAHPEKLEFDEKVRQLPPLAEPGSKTYDLSTSAFQAACFDVVESMTRDIDWEPCAIEGTKARISPEEAAFRVRGFARYMGAVSAGCTSLNPAYVYSRIGRSPGPWGEEIELYHTHALAFTVEMAHDMSRHAPDSPTTTETARRYLEAAKIAMSIARYINMLGYEARAHVDGNYRVMCVPVAVDAGLGEVGRLGLLITPDLGPRVRLAVVTTDLPLAQDKPIAFGVQDFCDRCKKCADMCPSASVDTGDRQLENGSLRWKSKQDSCYRYWRMAGSDCFICAKVCPYSHPSNLAHNTVRWFIKRNGLARQLALWADDIAYGRKPKASYTLPGWHRRDV